MYWEPGKKHWAMGKGDVSARLWVLRTVLVVPAVDAEDTKGFVRRKACGCATIARRHTGGWGGEGRPGGLGAMMMVAGRAAHNYTARCSSGAINRSCCAPFQLKHRPPTIATKSASPPFTSFTSPFLQPSAVVRSMASAAALGRLAANSTTLHLMYRCVQP